MTKIRTLFKASHPLFMPFIMAGYPEAATTANALLALAEAGADIIELGVPFSDPIADGPVNQRAAQIGLQNGATLSWCLTQVKQFKSLPSAVPVVLMSYLNPILAMGIESFVQQAQDAGVDGVLIVDLPPEEGIAIFAYLKQHHLEIALLVSPTTDPTRLSLYKDIEPAFIYYISRLGVTGLQSQLTATLEEEIKQLKPQMNEIPVVVGFGVSTVEQAKQIAWIADGVVIGSLLVNELEKGINFSFKKLIRELVIVING